MADDTGGQDMSWQALLAKGGLSILAVYLVWNMVNTQNAAATKTLEVVTSIQAGLSKHDDMAKEQSQTLKALVNVNTQNCVNGATALRGSQLVRDAQDRCFQATWAAPSRPTGDTPAVR